MPKLVLLGLGMQDPSVSSSNPDFTRPSTRGVRCWQRELGTVTNFTPIYGPPSEPPFRIEGEMFLYINGQRQRFEVDGVSRSRQAFMSMAVPGALALKMCVDGQVAGLSSVTATAGGSHWTSREKSLGRFRQLHVKYSNYSMLRQQ